MFLRTKIDVFNLKKILFFANKIYVCSFAAHVKFLSMKKLSFLILFLMCAFNIEAQDAIDNTVSSYQSVDLDGNQENGIQRVIELLSSGNLNNFQPSRETYEYVILEYTEHRRKNEKAGVLANLDANMAAQQEALIQNLAEVITQAGDIDFEESFQNFEMEIRRNQASIKGGNAIINFLNKEGKQKTLYISGLYQLADGEWYILNKLKWLN